MCVQNCQESEQTSVLNCIKRQPNLSQPLHPEKFKVANKIKVKLNSKCIVQTGQVKEHLSIKVHICTLNAL
jgi:hypothetical protein